MLTRFSEAQRCDPVIRDAESILRTCVHCGFCTATCPTFVLRGDELDSPRGRIVLIKEMHERGGRPTGAVVKHLDRCLTCLSCMTTCPSGVDYLHLVDGARQRIEADPAVRPLHQRLVRRLLVRLLSSRALFRASLRLVGVARPLAPLLPRRLGRLLALLPKPSPQSPATAVHPAIGHRRLRVALLTGCAQAVVGDDINQAAIRLLTRHGVEVVVADVPCCGGLAHHMGQADLAAGQAGAAVAGWWQETVAAGGTGLDAVVITTSGCGTTVKDYGHMFRGDPMLAARAAEIAGLTVDITELIERIGLAAPVIAAGRRVAYHAACSLQHGQRVRSVPQALLRQAGFDVQEVPEGHLCCGSAGTYNVLQADLADALKARKQANILSVAPEVVAGGNLGCILQIGGGFAVPVLHTVQLLDWATGGPMPVGLR